MTKSSPAIRSYTSGVNAMVFDSDWQAAQIHFEQAVEDAPTFAAAYLQLMLTYLLTN
ncbi:MAG: hypothetical protein ACE5I1_02745 [bacterium]